MRPGAGPDRVTVAIPAYNAAATLDETLWSVRRQTHADLQILVVDDGSTDRTAAIARRHAREDARLTLLEQSNAGVSAARNAALDRAEGALFATIDADDVWHPGKIECQVRAMHRDGEGVVLNYTWFTIIDRRGRIVATAEPTDEGCVLDRMCRGNLMGNGSSALMRTASLRQIGGWDVALVRGNEDYKAFFLLAERGRFAVVRAYLLGYRQLPDNRSSKSRRMMESYDQVLAELRPRYPGHAAAFDQGRSELVAYLYDKAVCNRNWRSAAFLLAEARHRGPADLAVLLRHTPVLAARLLVPHACRLRLKQTMGRDKLPSRLFSMIGQDVGIRACRDRG